MPTNPSQPPVVAASMASATDTSVGSPAMRSKTPVSIPAARSSVCTRATTPEKTTNGSQTMSARVTPSRTR